MPEPQQNPYPPNVQVELARERNRIAADRSLLSFIRSSTTLIGVGVGIDQVVTLVLPANIPIGGWTYTLSLVLVGLGVSNLLFAALDYQGEMMRLKQPDYSFTPRWSLGAVTGWVLFVIGIVAFIRL